MFLFVLIVPVVYNNRQGLYVVFGWGGNYGYWKDSAWRKNYSYWKDKNNLDHVVLDVENSRIQYYLDARLNENITPEEVRLALAESNEQYERLKNHIEQNGGIYNPIWVVPDGNYYRVRETQLLPSRLMLETYLNAWRDFPTFKETGCYVPSLLHGLFCQVWLQFHPAAGCTARPRGNGY